MDSRLKPRHRTWTKLKEALVRRYGERPDQDTAEWHVSQRGMMPNETFADFTAGLQELVGPNKKSTKQLVRMEPEPKTLEDAVERATKVDDPNDNVARGMQNIGQAWATASAPYMIPISGTTGQMMVIPGVGAVGAGDAAEGIDGTAVTSTMAYFAHPKGDFKPYTGH
ncbi:hypothetical protein PHMEG_00031256, partial [Phytophthora megakarya]